MKTPKERDNLDLLELVLQLFGRQMYGSKSIHEAYWEARIELERRLQQSPSDGEIKTAEEILREYFEIDDVNGHEPIYAMPLTIVDMMEEYASQFKFRMPTRERVTSKAVELSELPNNNLTAQEQSFFVVGFQSCFDWISELNKGK